MYEIWPNARSENKREKSKRSIFSLIRRFSERKSPFSLSLSLSSLAACIYPRMELGCFSSCSPLLQPPWLLSCALVLAFIRRHPEEEDDARAHTHTHTAHSKGDEEKMDSLIFIQKKEYTDSSSSICPCRQPKKRRRDCLAWLGLAFYGFLSSSPWAPFFFHFCLSLISKGNRWTVKKRWIVRPQIWNKKRKEMKHQMRHKFDDDHFISLPTFFPPVDFTCLFPWADVNEAEGLIRQNINESREPSKARLTIKVLALQLDCCIAEAALAISFSAFHPESHSSPAPAVYYRDFCICCKDRCMLRIYTRRSLHVPVLFLLISLVCVFCAVQVALPCGV